MVSPNVNKTLTNMLTVFGGSSAPKNRILDPKSWISSPFGRSPLVCVTSQKTYKGGPFYMVPKSNFDTPKFF